MTEISLSGRGARGESQADILRRTGQFGVLPTDTDAEAMAKLNADAAAAADAAAGFALVAETTATGGWFDSLAAGAADVAEGEGYFVKDAEDRFYTAQKVGGIGVKGAEFTTAALFGAATGASAVGFSRAAAYSNTSLGGAASNQRITVKDNPYLALGNGVASDTAKIQQALTDYPHVAWRIPPGNYPTGNLTVTQGGGPGSGASGGGLYGDGQGVSNLICTAPGDALTLNNCWNFHVENLSFKTAGAYRGIAGQRAVVTAGNTSGCFFRDLDILGFDGGGLQLLGTVGTQQSGHRVKGLWLQANGGHQFYSKYANDFIYEDIQAGYMPGTAHAATGVMLEKSNEGLLTGTMLWNNNIGIKELNCQGNRYLGNRTEESDQEGWYSDGSTACNYIGNIIHTNSQVASGLYDNWYFTNFNRIIVAHNQVRTWNALFSRYGINFDVGDDLILDGNLVRGFDTVNFGPYRVGGGVTTMDGDDVIRLALNSLAAGQTRFMGQGYSATETDVMMAVWRKLAMLRMTVQSTGAPGAGQSYTHTLRKNAATDTAMVATATGAAAFSARAFTSVPNVLFDEYDAMTVKSIASGGTAGTPAFRGILLGARY